VGVEADLAAEQRLHATDKKGDGWFFWDRVPLIVGQTRSGQQR
jgi:hypothetical protein